MVLPSSLTPGQADSKVVPLSILSGHRPVLLMKRLRKPTLPDALFWTADASSMDIFASFEHSHDEFHHLRVLLYIS